MKIKEITSEDASVGATSSGAIAAAPVSPASAEPYGVGKQKKKKKIKNTIIKRANIAT